MNPEEIRELESSAEIRRQKAIKMLKAQLLQIKRNEASAIMALEFLGKDHADFGASIMEVEELIENVGIQHLAAILFELHRAYDAQNLAMDARDV